MSAWVWLTMRVPARAAWVSGVVAASGMRRYCSATSAGRPAVVQVCTSRPSGVTIAAIPWSAISPTPSRTITSAIAWVVAAVVSCAVTTCRACRRSRAARSAVVADRAMSRSAIPIVRNQAPRIAMARNSCRVAVFSGVGLSSTAHGPRPALIIRLAVTVIARPQVTTTASRWPKANQNSSGMGR